MFFIENVLLYQSTDVRTLLTMLLQSISLTSSQHFLGHKLSLSSREGLVTTMKLG